MTVASRSSEKLGAVNVGSMFEHLRKERFLKSKFSLAVLDGRLRRSCIEELATSVQPGDE